MLLHVKDTMTCVFKSVMIRTVGTDVPVLAVANFQGLPNIEQLGIAFGTGNDFRYIPIHEIASALCPQMAKGWLFCHAFTGCDVTSYFTNRGKKSAWKTWLAWPGSFVTLSLPYMYSKHTWGYHSETGTIRCHHVLPDQWLYECQYGMDDTILTNVTQHWQHPSTTSCLRPTY